MHSALPDSSFPLPLEIARPQVVAVAEIAQHRWRLLAPEKNAPSGRALRDRLVSYLI